MTIKGYKEQFNKIKKTEYDKMVKDFNQFVKLHKYKTKEKAVTSYGMTTIEIKDNLKCSFIGKRFSIDYFKHDFNSKTRFTFDDSYAPIESLLDIYYPQIIKEYNAIRKNELRLNENPSFDYVFFDNFSKKIAIDFIAKIIAFKDFEEYLYRRESGIDKKMKEIDISTKSVTVEAKPTLINTEETKLISDKQRKVKKIKNIALKYKYDDDVVEILYNMLTKNSYINVKKADFLCHFKNGENNNYKRMVWNTDDVKILYLFHNLKTVEAKPYDIIYNHFLTQYEELFNVASLQQSWNKIKKMKEKEKNEYKDAIKYDGKEQLYENIEEILDKVNKIL